MMKTKHNPAAFINVIAEDGTKGDAVAHLQITWNQLMNLHTALFGLGFTKQQVEEMETIGYLSNVL